MFLKWYFTQLATWEVTLRQNDAINMKCTADLP